MRTKSIVVFVIAIAMLNTLKAQQDENYCQNSKWNPVTELQLTSDQEAQYNKLRETKMNSMNELRTKKQNLQKEYHLAMQDRNAPIEKLYNNIEEMAAVDVKMRKLHVEYMFDFRDMLSPEQYTKFLEHQKIQNNPTNRNKNYHHKSQSNKINKRKNN